MSHHFRTTWGFKMLSTQFDSIPMTDQGAASEKGMRGQARPFGVKLVARSVAGTRGA